jgi:protein-disulfide isomerase
MLLRRCRHLQFLLFSVIAAVLLFTTPRIGLADADDNFSKAQKLQMEKLIRQYIMDHPEVILESVQRHQAQREQADKGRAKANLVTYKEQLVADPTSPVGGNVKGDVTIVEFFDYRCGFCKRVYPTVKKVLDEDKGIRYVYKEFPILGPQSVTASRASLAVWNMAPEKYHAFHDILMTDRGAITEAKVIKVAEKLGIKPAALKKAMADKTIDTVLARNFKLAEALNINGTPAFVIGDQLVPGAIDRATLIKLIAEARGS